MHSLRNSEGIWQHELLAKLAVVLCLLMERCASLR